MCNTYKVFPNQRVKISRCEITAPLTLVIEGEPVRGRWCLLKAFLRGHMVASRGVEIAYNTFITSGEQTGLRFT